MLEAPTADDTRAAGDALAPLLRPRDVVVLTGELGAGKTTFVQGVAQRPRCDEHVTSPTFTLVSEYSSGRVPLAHVDVYRLDRDAGRDRPRRWTSSSDGERVLLVEWGDAVAALLAEDRLRIELAASDPTGADETRRIAIAADAGDAWTHRRRADRRAAPWNGGRRDRRRHRDRRRRRPPSPSAPSTEILGRIQMAGQARQESVTPALQQLLAWTGIDLGHVGGFAVGIGPACSPASASAWRPRRRSPRCRRVADRGPPAASTRSPTPSGTRRSDRRRDRRPAQGGLLPRSTGRCPAACRACRSPAVAPPDAPGRRAPGRRAARCWPVGDGAHPVPP